MPTISDQAVVLGRLDFSETSQVVVFFTREHGKVRAIAKGVKRGTKTRFATGLDLLDIGHVVFSSRQERGPGLAVMTEWKQTRVIPQLRTDLRRLYGALYMAEVTGRLTEDFDPHAALFDAFMAALADLAERPDPLASVVRYQLDLLEAIGLLPRFDQCVQCGRSGDLTHFSSFEGGMICRHCEPAEVEKRGVSEAVRKLCATGRRHASLQLVASAASGWPIASAVGASNRKTSVDADTTRLIKDAFELLNYHIAHLSGRAPLLAEKLIAFCRKS